MVMVVGTARMGSLETRLAVADGHSLNQPVLEQQLEYAVDAGPARRLTRGSELLLDLHCTQSAGL
jgi:hypothetical protein